MAAAWKERMKMRARLNQEARDSALASMTDAQAVELLEGLLANPLRPPRRKRSHPVALSRRRRRRV
jgi:hypothetical protein